MKDVRRVLAMGASTVLVACFVFLFLTRGAMEQLSFLKAQAGGQSSGNLVDQRPWQTAASLAPLAVTAEEREFAQDAERLADHEVDQAFAMALREANAETRTLSGEALALQQRVEVLNETVKEDQARLDALSTEAKGKGEGKAGADAGAGTAGAGAGVDGTDLDVAKAQLGLDNDELADAVEDLARESGDKRGKIQAELTAHEAAMKQFDAGGGGGAQIAVLTAARYGTLYGRVNAWFSQRSRDRLIAQAAESARVDVAALTAKHNKMEAVANAAEGGGARGNGGAGTATGTERVRALEAMGARRKILSILDDRIQTETQLATVYGRWRTQVALQHRIVLHLIAQSVATIAGIVLLTVFLNWVLRSGLSRFTRDRRQEQTLGTISDLFTEIFALVLVLFVMFGVPKQTPTILGLATAGLTVVFQDFILAFFGWFVLMGKKGVRPCDWVEINGVGGEVMEVGLFRTALLETGNWTANGHPTGRRVTFLNSYAIRGQYFNFSTDGQWMWDEIKVNVPSGPERFALIDRIHEAVVQETAGDAAQAEAEWKRVTMPNGLSQFSATPAVNMRPAAAGVDVVVRYVTRAGSRLETRNRLYERVVELMEAPAGVPEAVPAMS